MHPGVHARSHPDKPAVIMAGSGRTLTYGQLEDRSRRLAHLLRAAGLGRGDHLALLSDNRPEAYEVYWAAMRIGLYFTAVNSHLTAAEAAFIVEDCGADALVVSSGVPAATAVGELTARPRLRLAFGAPPAGFDAYDDELAGAPEGTVEDQSWGTEMLYSSGTTGRPKGIERPLPSIAFEQENPFHRGLATGFFFDPDCVYLSPAPIYHAAPLGFTTMVQSIGGTVVMMERFDAEAALVAIDAHGITHSQWVPTMFTRLLKLPPEVRDRLDGSTHRVAVHAAAPCPPAVKQAMIGWWGPILYEYYAATERHGMTMIDSEDWLAHPGSVGRSAQGNLRICGEDGELLPAGQVGTIFFEQPERRFRYHGDDDKTESAAHPGHPTWMTTGDVGYVDEDGYLFLAERQAFMVISGGVNIYPQEIEAALALHPKVADVAVIGVPDEDLGEAVKAVVQPTAGVTGDDALAQEILVYLGERIARYKVPRTVDFSDDLPRTPTGKLVKGKLRDRYIKVVNP